MLLLQWSETGARCIAGSRFRGVFNLIVKEVTVGITRVV